MEGVLAQEARASLIAIAQIGQAVTGQRRLSQASGS